MRPGMGSLMALSSRGTLRSIRRHLPNMSEPSANKKRVQPRALYPPRGTVQRVAPVSQLCSGAACELARGSAKPQVAIWVWLRLDLDAPPGGRRGPRQADLQDAIPVVRLDLVGVRPRRQRERPFHVHVAAARRQGLAYLELGVLGVLVLRLDGQDVA